MSSGLVDYPTRIGSILKPMKAEWMVTRRCNMRCGYCIVPDSRVDELSQERRFTVLDILKEYGVGIVVLYGGEVTLLGDGLLELLEHSNDIGLFCAVITNGSKLCQDKDFFERYSRVAMNLTVSVDWLPESSNNRENDKSLLGWRVILDPISRVIPDRVINATMFRQNAREIPSIVRRASDEGIWSILSLLNVGKPGFRYSGKCPDIKFREEDRNLLCDVCDELLDMRRSGRYLMHDEETVYYSWKQWGISQNWHCSRFTKFTIDADGTVPCCVDWQGADPVTIFDVVKDETRFRSWFERNIWDCPGCCWSPLILLESFKSREEGNSKLSHGRSYGGVVQ